jgi:kinesin family protein 18/19
MIDLAGSERGAKTGNTGKRMFEGCNINRSLLALGNCINQLYENCGRAINMQKHVPFRDSKLTRILKDSLGGNCKTIMIANISPTNGNLDDTLNTLKYANRTKDLSTDIKINVKLEKSNSPIVKLNNYDEYDTEVIDIK